ncbi:MAG: ABC transporter ATP-binding protein [Nocardioides sp.]|nr:ABC transporter ATP-binding protein [Nocardioides sp.]
MSDAGDTNDTVLSVRSGRLSFGERTLWSDLDLDLRRGEFLTVLGSNGSGKSSLLKAVLGLQRLTAGSITIDGRTVTHGDRHVGYVPQQRLIPPGTPMRGRDLVALGLDGHRPGLPMLGRREARRRVTEMIEAAGATGYADRPVGRLSGGEQQRLRVAQALVGDPSVLLCDEPLLSLDLQQQRAVSALIDARRRSHGTPVVFVTHDVNPILAATDRILYFANGRHRLGTPDEVLRSDVLSELYGTPVEVARIRGRVVVLGTPDDAHCEADHGDQVHQRWAG